MDFMEKRRIPAIKPDYLPKMRQYLPLARIYPETPDKNSSPREVSDSDFPTWEKGIFHWLKLHESVHPANQYLPDWFARPERAA